MRSAIGRIRILLCACVLLLSLVVPPPAWAGPVEWREVPATPEGRQWWDAGSLRRSRTGSLTVLSRFQPPAEEGNDTASPGRQPPSTLYVMELDCAQELYRDLSVNGLPRFRAEWQAASGDALSTAVLRASCRAGEKQRLASLGGGDATDG